MINEIGNQILLSGSNAIVGTSINLTSTFILLIATALVLFMVPGLAIFYGGLVRRKNVSTIIAQSFISMTVVTLIWIFGGFSLAFGPTLGGFIGDPTKYFLFRNILFNDWKNLTLTVNTTLATGVPFIVFFLFQLAFAIITPALVTGAFADRLNYRGYILFTILFTLFIYIPVCHWVWGGGFLMTNGAVDWAGGVVIHATCGAAAIASVLVLKKRVILKNENVQSHSLPLVAIGAAILFFGWFGFNTGSSVYAGLIGVDANTIQQMIINNNLLPDVNKLLSIGLSAFANSFIAMIFATVIWTSLDFIIKKHTSLTSILTAGIAGLATITPTAGFVPIWSSIIIGLIGGGICYGMTFMNHKIHFDDALEVWPVHGIGGLVGTILVSAFASIAVNSIGLSDLNGLININQIGSSKLLLWQFTMIIVVCAWSFTFAIGIFYLLIVLKCKVTSDQQKEGLDISIFHENSYDIELSNKIDLSNKTKN